MRSVRGSKLLTPLRATALALLTVACREESLTPAAPASTERQIVVPTLPPLPLSVVDAPISYALEPALAALESAVPRHFGDLEKRITIPKNTRQQIAFEARRTPFDVEFDGRRLTIGTTISYSGRGWYKPVIGPTISASCGTGDTQPRVRLVLHTDIDVTREWRLRTRTRIGSITPLTDTERDQCEVTAFQIDVTDRVMRSLEPVLEKRLPSVDRRIASFDLATRVEKWYNLLNRNIRIKDSLWLVLAPREVALGGLELADTALVAKVRLYARPVMVSGPRPAEVSTTLPPLSKVQGDVGDTARLRLEGLINYADANATLSKAIAGRSVRRFNQRVLIDSVRLYPLGDGRVALALALRGTVRGHAYFVGTPTIDTVRRMLTVPDLDFDVNTVNDLVRGLAWLKKGDIVDMLRDRAQLPLDTLLEDTRERVENALNRELTDGVRLSGSVKTGRLVDVVAMPQWLVVRAEAVGALALHVDRAIPAPKRRRAD